jgi:hypothetical protein
MLPVKRTPEDALRATNGARRRADDAHPFDQPLPSVEPALDLDGFEDPFDARVLPALDREDFDGSAIGIPPFLIESLKAERLASTVLLTPDTVVHPNALAGRSPHTSARLLGSAARLRAGCPYRCPDIKPDDPASNATATRRARGA